MLEKMVIAVGMKMAGLRRIGWILPVGRTFPFPFPFSENAPMAVVLFQLQFSSPLLQRSPLLPFSIIPRFRPVPSPLKWPV